jgi:regulation of enolase protein 1 (concanavalin A-like superfamily)
VFSLAGSGADIWGTSDAFQFLSQPIGGDTQIVARIASLQNTNTYAKAGLMLRETASAGAAQVILDVRPNGAVEFMSRPASGAATTFLAGGTQAAPAWLKLTRSGTSVSGWVSANGTAWTLIGSTSVAMANNALVGLAVTSHDVTQLNTATFDGVSVTASFGTGIPDSHPRRWRHRHERRADVEPPGDQLRRQLRDEQRTRVGRHQPLERILCAERAWPAPLLTTGR